MKKNPWFEFLSFLFMKQRRKMLAFLVLELGILILVNGWFLVDFASSIPAELESALRLKTVQYFITKRPWLGKFLCYCFGLLLYFKSSVRYRFLLFLIVSGFLFQIFMEFMLDLLRRLEVWVENHMLIQHWYTVACLMSCFLRYSISGHKLLFAYWLLR